MPKLRFWVRLLDGRKHEVKSIDLDSQEMTIKISGRRAEIIGTGDATELRVCTNSEVSIEEE
jgi:hypothetical protein